MPGPEHILEKLLHHVARLPPAIACYLGARTLKATVNSAPLILNACDPIHQEIAVLRNREPWFTRVLEKTLLHTRPRVVIDAGANVGYYLTLYYKTYQIRKTPLTVIALEPSPRNLYLLKENTRLQQSRGGPRTVVLPLALGEKNGKAVVEEGETSNLDHILPHTGGSMRKTINVTLIRLDTLQRLGIIPCPQLIRMDIEGYEYQALRGAAETLKECRPLLALELHPQTMKRYHAGIEELMQFLEEQEYRILYHEWGPKTTLQTLTPKRTKYTTTILPLVPPTKLTKHVREGSMIIAYAHKRRA